MEKAKGPRQKQITHGKAYAKARPDWQKGTHLQQTLGGL